MENIEPLRQQVAVLERRLRRIQGAIGIILLALTATIVMAQTASKRVLTANEFVLRDSAGVDRAKLGLERGGASLTIFDSQRRMRVRLSEGLAGDGRSPTSDEAGQIDLYGGGGRMVNLHTGSDGSRLLFWRVNESPGTGLTSEINLSGESVEPGVSGGPRLAMGSPSNARHIVIDAGAPQIRVMDGEGFETHIGSTDLIVTQTGTTSKTSAASLVLFDKNKKVLWSAPR